MAKTNRHDAAGALACGAVLWCWAAGGSAAAAETLWMEAEQYAVDGVAAGVFTSPLLIKDDDGASGGAYLEVAPGNNSLAAPPVSEGVATYRVELAGGSYTLWARVMAPTDADDSFWFQIDDGDWVQWNRLPHGDSWRWTSVADEDFPDDHPQPPSFFLSEGAHRLRFAYREDGTRLDLLVITSDPAFDPTAPLAGPPAPPRSVQTFSGPGGVQFTWSAVPGASSYTVERSDENGFRTVATGLRGHAFTDTVGGCYRVFAVAATGTSPPSEDHGRSCGSPEGFELRTDSFDMGVALPMFVRAFKGIVPPQGLTSLDAPPAHGRARLDFRLAGRARISAWLGVRSRGPQHDSLWVRVDEGRWIRWNDIAPSGGSVCTLVRDSDDGGRPALFEVGPGSHRLEIAYREDGLSVSGTIMLVQGLPGRDPCPD